MENRRVAQRHRRNGASKGSDPRMHATTRHAVHMHDLSVLTYHMQRCSILCSLPERQPVLNSQHLHAMQCAPAPRPHLLSFSPIDHYCTTPTVSYYSEYLYQVVDDTLTLTPGEPGGELPRGGGGAPKPALTVGGVAREVVRSVRSPREEGRQCSGA